MLTDIFSFFIKDIYCYQQVIVEEVYAPVALILYAHIPTAIIAIVVGIFLLKKDKTLQSRIFFFLTLAFFIFTLGDFVEWFMFVGRDFVMFARSIIEKIDPVLFILSSYLLFVLIKKKDVDFIYKIIWLLPLVPLIVRSVLGLNLTGYNWQICEVVESEFSTAYIYYIDLFYMVSAILFAIWSIIRGKGNRKEISIISVGVCSFIVLFFAMEYVFSGYIFSGVFDYNYFLYAFFGMPILIVFLAYLAVQFKTFNTKLLTAQVVVFGILALIFAQFFFLNNPTAFILNTIAFMLAAIMGRIIIRNIQELDKANNDKSEFISFASHEIRNPLTSIIGFASNILEADYGPVNAGQKDAVQKILVSGKNVVALVGEYLNKSKMELDKIEYDFTDFDIAHLVKEIVKGFEPSAEQAKVTMTFTADESATYPVNADEDKLKEVIGNILNNAIKFAPGGSIGVSVSRKDDKALVKISDTGKGMDDEIKAGLFKKFSQSKATKGGSGLGLYLAKMFVEAQKGKIWGESEGVGKGSTFFVELPVKVG